MPIKNSDKSNGVPEVYSVLKRYKTSINSSFYLEMRDGVKLAVDLHLPEGIEDEKIPAIIHQTRYRRGIAIRKPFNWFFSGRGLRKLDKIREHFVNSGYAWLNVDVRGTGASFGEWQYPWWKEEVKDGIEIIDWVIQQDWSNQNVGTTGISYAGTAAEFLAAQQHPALKACIPMYSLFDVYDDIVMPGGVFLRWFVESWELTNRRLDQNKKPPKASMVSVLTNGVKKVNQGENFTDVIKAHEKNTNIAEEAAPLNYRDDLSPGLGIKMDDFSPHHQIDALNQSKTAIYSWSGWYDGTYAHAAIKRFLNLKHNSKKLIIGPWDHGGKYNIDQFSKSTFHHSEEMLKFFDFHLKNKTNDLAKESPIHYYTLVEGKWKSAQQWPPHQYETVFYLNQGNQLQEKKSTETNSVTEYEVDHNCSSGKWTRYRALNGVEKKAMLYKNWHKRKGKSITFESKPLETDRELTGHPLVELYLESNQPDGNLFVYLEDVDERGQAAYITEGMLRLIHRNAFAENLHLDVVPVRSYLKEQSEEMPGGIAEKVQVDLLPISYLIKKNHRIRISICGSDVEYFNVNNSGSAIWKLHHSVTKASKLKLPIINH